MQRKSIAIPSYPSSIPLFINLDKAWTVLNNELGDQYNLNSVSALSNQGQEAYNFMLYALNIKLEKNPAEAMEEIKEKMAEREKVVKTKGNKKYIPGAAPKYIDEQALLSVNELKKLEDENSQKKEKGKIPYLRKVDRAQYHVIISQNQFMQDGKPFDTKEMSSHRKKGYAAFTLNAHGEISIFKHGINENLQTLAHSSMNKGKEVVGAGEVVITNGELKVINTYSGHYQPSPAAVFRALLHFEEQGIDISKVKIQTFDNPEKFGLSESDYTESDIPGQDQYYEFTAEKMIGAVQAQLKVDIRNFQKKLDEYDSKKDNFTRFFSKVPLVSKAVNHDNKKIYAEQKQLVTENKMELKAITNKLSNATSYSDIYTARQELLETMKSFTAVMKQIANNYNKPKDAPRQRRLSDTTNTIEAKLKEEDIGLSTMRKNR